MVLRGVSCGAEGGVWCVVVLSGTCGVVLRGMCCAHVHVD